MQEEDDDDDIEDEKILNMNGDDGECRITFRGFIWLILPTLQRTFGTKTQRTWKCSLVK